jgi:hypothetical protein
VIQDANKAQRQLIINITKKYNKRGTGSGISLLNSRTWTYYVPDLRQFIKRSSYIIVGGVATRLYMPERMTLDLDILIRSSESSITYQELSLSGCVKVGNLSIPGTQWKLPDGSELDVLESNAEWVELALQKPNYAPDGQPVIKLEYLVLMKLLAGRTQDIADISRMLGGLPDQDLTQVRTVIHEYLPTALEDLESLITLGNLERL